MPFAKDSMLIDDTTEALTARLQAAAAALLAHLGTATVIVPLHGDSSASYIVVGDKLALSRFCRAISTPAVAQDWPAATH